MVDHNDFWDSNYYNHPDLTDEMVGIAEELLKVKLPASYINLLKIMNGGYTKGFAFPMAVPTTWSENHIPLDTLNGIDVECDEDIHVAYNFDEFLGGLVSDDIYGEG